MIFCIMQKILLNNPNFQIPNIELKNIILYELEKLLNINLLSLTHFNLPLPIGSLMNDLNNKLIREELNHDINALKLKALYWYII